MTRQEQLKQPYQESHDLYKRSMNMTSIPKLKLKNKDDDTAELQELLTNLMANATTDEANNTSAFINSVTSDSSMNISNVYPIGSSSSGYYANWGSSISDPSNYLRTVFNIDNLSIQENNQTTDFKEWLKNFIKETLLVDLLDLQQGEIANLKTEIENMKKMMEDVFQEAAITKLEHIIEHEEK